MNRAHDWLMQAERDLRHASRAIEGGDYEWAGFAAQQASEKAIKALILSRGGEPWGHSVTALVEALPPELRPEEPLFERAKRLDKHYILTRYPHGFDSGFPGAYYTKGEAEQACVDAQVILDFCRSHLARP